jgi:hypothetical protein
LDALRNESGSRLIVFRDVRPPARDWHGLVLLCSGLLAIAFSYLRGAPSPLIVRTRLLERRLDRLPER